ncbi:MAG: chromosome segregation protein SMC [Aureispira sp.]|nr:chromosome segregation protein SMC [Aureispira sp.]
MRLKSLEIKGFKSFADKTIINFSEDVIGIVGSNGCGKSNIVDAIRWVLGEQKTKHLRSDSMTNVIFNGTKSRKSSGLAEVTLVFENDKGILALEYREVSIKRMLYKDGSSEYRLNGIKCRLKDITNLLVDTGMGPDSYAIIALGMVDDLLQDKDNSRLKLFEQAAGISKYKKRKKETLSKLKGTEADLERVEDLLFEIEKNLKTLERQAKRAKRYFQIKEDYKQLSLELSYFKISKYKTAYKAIDTQIEAEKKKEEQLKKEIAQLEKQIESEKTANLDKEQALAEKQRQLNRLTGQIKGKENDKKILAQKTLFIQQNNEKLDTRIVNTEQKILENQKDLDKYNGQLESEGKILAILDKEMQEAKTQLEKIRETHGSVKKELEGFMQQQNKLNNQIFEQEKNVAVNSSQQENNSRSIERIERNLAERQKEVEIFQKEATQLQERQTGQEQQLAQLKKAEEERKAKLQTTEETLEGAKEKLIDKNRRLDAKRNEFKLLKGLVESMEGFAESIKFLHKNQSWANGAPVLLSDIFYCPPEYRTAIENYLEGYLSYYVVQDFKEAIQAIQLLDKNKKGKANFFVLDQFPKNATNNNSKAEGTAALDILEFDAVYQPLAQHLLGHVSIVEDLEQADQSDKTKVWLTLDGKFTQQAFSIRGGSVGAFEGKKIGRKKNLELLEKQITTLDTERKELQATEQTLRAQLQQLRQANKQRDIQHIEQQLNQTIRQSITVKGKLDSFEQFAKDIQQQRTQLQTQIQQLQSKKLAAQELLKQLQIDSEQLKSTVSEKDASVQSIAEKLSSSSSNYNRKHIEQVRQQNKIAGIQKEVNFCKRQQQELQTQLDRDKKMLLQADSDLNKVQTDIQEAEKVLAEWYDRKKLYQQELATAEKVFFESRGNITQIEKDLRQKNHAYQQNMQLIHQLENKFNDIKLQLTSIGERLNVEFEVDIDDIIDNEPNPEYTEAELEPNVAKLRKQLHNYGSINPMAIEAYDEIKERYDLIIKQRADLVEAKTNLLDTIAEIESKATDKFMAAFREAREHFIRVFRSLFLEDDTCDLLLTDPDNPLESKIEIVAKPKGKRPLSINQLSGGEKTLTATALLFALYLLKPAPFCIFDEVDAPLDDANIAKFNNIIKEFSKNSQFIIVTHNKKSMEAVDIMYGVTMVQGVSKVVPVDFRSLAATT